MPPKSPGPDDRGPSRILSDQLPKSQAFDIVQTSPRTSLATGVAPKVAAERLGHADPTLFTNLYSHVTPTMQREAADKIGMALFGTGTMGKGE